MHGTIYSSGPQPFSTRQTRKQLSYLWRTGRTEGDDSSGDTTWTTNTGKSKPHQCDPESVFQQQAWCYMCLTGSACFYHPASRRAFCGFGIHSPVPVWGPLVGDPLVYSGFCCLSRVDIWWQQVKKDIPDVPPAIPSSFSWEILRHFKARWDI